MPFDDKSIADCSVPNSSDGLIFSVTRRSRSDECDLLTESLDVSIDLTDVTLVSDDTNRRLF